VSARIAPDATGGTALEIEVHDEGCGIEPAHLPRVFERFYRVDKGRSRTLGGTGLGLSIVKHIVQAHGGTVGVESTPGVGTTFTLRMPA
jgi:two-component system phosphate regulon sensor histidine kinase PhoR